MELNRVFEEEIVASFELTMIPKICGQVRELQENNGVSWQAFAQASKEYYFMKDSKRVTKRTFLEWVARKSINK